MSYMNSLMLIVGIVIFILGIGSLFRKNKIGPKSNPRYSSPMELGPSYLFPVMIGIIIIAFAIK
jgi:hypothetical protein